MFKIESACPPYEGHNYSTSTMIECSESASSDDVVDAVVTAMRVATYMDGSIMRSFARAIGIDPDYLNEILKRYPLSEEDLILTQPLVNICDFAKDAKFKNSGEE